MPAVAERQVQRLNQKDPEAAPIVETEMFNPTTGERVVRGWKCCKPTEKGYPNFTIPAPDHIAPGLRPEFASARPGRYFIPSQNEAPLTAADLELAGAEIVR